MKRIGEFKMASPFPPLVLAGLIEESQNYCVAAILLTP